MLSIINFVYSNTVKFCSVHLPTMNTTVPSPSPAFDAARHGRLAELQEALASGFPVDEADAKGNTLLMLAAYHGRTEAVELLLEHGADPDRRNARGQTPLGGVAFKGHLRVARLLLQAGADPLADQGGGRLPIMYAAVFGHPAMVELLRHAAGESEETRRCLAWLAALVAAPRRLLFPRLYRGALVA